MPDLRRRRLLFASAGLYGLSSSGLALPVWAAAKPSAQPFTLGVASGDPVPDGFVLWTRLAPLPLDGGGMPEGAVEVIWELSEKENFAELVRQGTATAEPAWAHSLHVEVAGLRPQRDYWYRFRCGEFLSPVGRARTAPAAGTMPERFRFAFASCQHWEHGYYAAYRHMAADHPDPIVHLGDYIYESSSPADDAVRRHAGPEPVTLAQYRNHHAQYKTDPDLQAAHAACPWLVTWDDHDVQNDYAGSHPQNDAPPEQFLLRRAAAYQAYWEHMPLRLVARPSGSDMLLYRQLRFGDLLQMTVLDERQYRSNQPCATSGHGGGQVVPDCPERRDPARTLLGPTQEQWLLGRLKSSRSRWNVIAQQLLMAQLDQQPGTGEKWWTDGWDGYPAARARILSHLQTAKIANPVVIGGDIHSFWANDLKADFADPRSATVASEFTGTSISSRSGGYEKFLAMLPDNPHIRFFDSRSRGYALCDVTAARWQTDFIALDDARKPDSAAHKLRSFVVEAGRPGVQVA